MSIQLTSLTSTMISRNDIIRSTTTLARNLQEPPLVVVGLPRSGSSLLSHLLSSFPNWYVFDDLYIRSETKQFKSPNTLDDAALDVIRKRLFWILHSRIKSGSFSAPNITIEQAQELADSIINCFIGKRPHWKQIHSEFLVRLALLNGATHWGWKCPGDFRALPELHTLFPELRVIFLHRHPEHALVSKKFVTGGDGDGKLYHPVAYAIYWQLAFDKATASKEKHPENFIDIPFKELTENHEKSTSRLCEFLNESDTHLDELPKPNSSFSSRDRKNLTYIEILIIRLICKRGMHELGYETIKSSPRKIGVLDIIKTTSLFIWFQTKRVVTSGSDRVRVFELAQTFVQGLFGRR